MASKTRYTDVFQKKVVEDYKKGDLSQEEVAAKYDLPIALLKSWIKDDEFNSFLVRLAKKTDTKEPFFKRVKFFLKTPFLWLKKYVGHIVGCLSLLFIGGVLVNFRPGIIESERQDLQQSVLLKMDSLMKTESDVKEKLESLEMIDSTLNAIHDQLKTRIIPLMTIQTNKPVCNCKKDFVK